jgi:Ser/Thr protein kinase RdoA (MazF antagonist)
MPMSTEYSDAVVADLHAMVAASLGCWGLSTGTRIALLSLSENATFTLQDRATRRDLVLRVHRVGYSSAAEIRSELAWINALRGAAVIETAVPVAGADGELIQTLESPGRRASRHAVAFERLPGREPGVSVDAHASNSAPLAGWFQQLGAVTAKLHLHVGSWAPPEGFVRKRWDLETMVGASGHWGPWRESIGLNASGATVIETALERVRNRLEAFGSGPERFGLVHADLRLANLLVEGTQLRVIDFDDCGFSWFLYDFASAVSFIEHEAIVPELLRAWVAGYRECAPLTEVECGELPTFVILRRILLSAWLASHREVPLAQQLGARFTLDTVSLARQFAAGEFLV